MHYPECATLRLYLCDRTASIGTTFVSLISQHSFLKNDLSLVPIASADAKVFTGYRPCRPNACIEIRLVAYSAALHR